jgi:hypothetical protein
MGSMDVTQSFNPSNAINALHEQMSVLRAGYMQLVSLGNSGSFPGQCAPYCEI